MQTYRFDLPQLSTPRIISVYASSVQYVRGNAQGFSNAILMSADSTSQRVRMVPGQKLKFSSPIQNLYIENADGEADIVGELVAGLADFTDSRVIGNLTVSDRDVAASIEGKNFWTTQAKAVAASGTGNAVQFALRNTEDNGSIVVLRRLVFSCKSDAFCRISTGWQPQRDFGGNLMWEAWGGAWHKQGLNSRAFGNPAFDALKGKSTARLYVDNKTFPFADAPGDFWFRQSYNVDKLPRVIEPGTSYSWLIHSPSLATVVSCDIEWTELTESDTEFI